MGQIRTLFFKTVVFFSTKIIDSTEVLTLPRRWSGVRVLYILYNFFTCHCNEQIFKISICITKLFQKLKIISTIFRELLFLKKNFFHILIVT